MFRISGFGLLLLILLFSLPRSLVPTPSARADGPLATSADLNQLFPRMTPPTQIAMPNKTIAAIAVDKRNIDHVAWTEETPSVVKYFNSRWDSRSANGWSTPETVATTARQLFGYPSIAVNSVGTVYVAWTERDVLYDSLYYSFKTLGGAWQGPFVYAQGSVTYTGEDITRIQSYLLPRIRCDNSDNIHITCIYDDWHNDYQGNVQWESILHGVNFGPLAEVPGSLGDVIQGDYPTAYHYLALGGTDAHVAWIHVRAGGRLALFNRQTAGTWQNVLTVDGNNPLDVNLVADESQTTHLVWALQSEVKYAACANGILGLAEQISTIYDSFPRVFISIKGDSPQVFWSAVRTELGGVTELSYAMRSGGWHKQEPVFDAQMIPEEMATDANGFPRLINADIGELSYTRIWEPNMGWQDAFVTAGWGPNTSANLSNGNLQTTLPLFSSSGVGFSAGISLIYNALDTFHNVMSQGWHITYHLSLTDHDKDTYEGAPTGTKISVIFGDGHSVVYEYAGAPYGYYIPHDEYGDSSRIERSGVEYILVTKHGIRYTFNSAGKLRLISDTNTNSLSLVYTNGVPTSIVDSAQRVTTLNYGDNPISENSGEIVLLSIADPGTKTYTFGYDVNDKLLTVTYNGVTPAISWTATHSTVNNAAAGERVNLLRKLKTPKQEETTFSYLLDNRADSTQSPAVDYLDENGQTLHQPLGRIIDYDDAAHQAVLTNRRGYTTTVAYKYRYCVAVNITDAKNGTVARAFDDKRRLNDHTDRNGKTTHYEYDATATPSYVNDNLETVLRPGAAAPTFYAYTDDGLNNLSSAVDPLGHAISYQYWENGTGNLKYVIYPAADVWIDGQLYSMRTSSEYYEYDGKGRMTLNRSPNLGETTYVYDPNPANNPSGLVTQISRTGIAGSEHFVYDVMGNLTQQTRPEGGVTDYVLDGLYRVSQQIAPAGYAGRGTTAYHFTDNSQLDYVVDPLLNETHYAYDAANRTISITNAAGKSMTYRYDAGGNTREVVDFRGNTVKTLYDELDRVVEERQPGTTIAGVVYSPDLVTTYTYWPNGNLKDRTVGGTKTTSYTYDDRNNLKTTTYPIASIVETISYDDNDQLIRRVLRDNGIFMGGSENTYDLRNRLSQTRQLDQDPNLGVSGPVTLLGYDDAGNQSHVVDPAGRFNDSFYDGFNRRLHAKDGYGVIVAQTDYDADDRQILTKIQHPNGTGLTTSSGYEYYPDGRVKFVKDALNNASEFRYDLNGNMTGSFDAELNETVNEYDNLNRMWRQTRYSSAFQPVVTQFGFDENGNRTSVTDPRNKTYGYSYDKMNRLYKIVYPLASSEIWKYDAWGNMASHTDANGKIAGYDYDAMDRLVTEAQGAPYNVSITRTYDGASNLTQITDGTIRKDFVYDTDNRKLNRLGRVDYTVNGSAWKSIAYSYDDASNRTGMTDPEGAQYVYSYTPNAQLSSVSRNSSSVVQNSYDSGGRKIRADLGNGTSLRYNYDVKERLTNVKALRSQGDTVSSFTYGYNKIDNRTSMKIDHENVLVNYGYDGLSRLTSESWNLGAAMSCANQFTSQPAGNESGFSSTVRATPTAGLLSSPYLAGYKYDEAGNRTGKYTLSGGSGYTVDDENKLTTEYPFTLTTVNPVSTVTQDNWVELDFGGSVALYRLDAVLPDTNRRFKIEYYDGTSYHDLTPLALLGANLDQGYYQPFATDCRFLIDGLIVQKIRYWQESGSASGVTMTAYTAVAGTSIAYGYDTNGNQTSRTQGTSVETLGYDYANRVISWTDQQSAYSYVFAPSGERMAKVNPDLSSEWYMYDGDDIVADYAKPSGGAYTLTASYANGLGIDSKIARFDAAGAPGYYIPDALGSVHRILDGSQNVVNTYLTNAWGESLYTSESVSNRYGFTQREKDSESGLMHYRARSYDPRLGRFIQKDPRGMIDGINLYVYARNNPIVLTDPTGRQSDQSKSCEVDIASDLRIRVEYVGKQDLHLTCVDPTKPKGKNTIGHLDENLGSIVHDNQPLMSKSALSRIKRRLAENPAKLKKLRRSIEMVRTSHVAFREALRAAKREGKALKEVPILGTVFALTVGLVIDIQDKGLANGLLNSAIDAVPYLGEAKVTYELASGNDFIPGKEDREVKELARSLMIQSLQLDREVLLERIAEQKSVIDRANKDIARKKSQLTGEDLAMSLQVPNQQIKTAQAEIDTLNEKASKIDEQIKALEGKK